MQRDDLIRDLLPRMAALRRDLHEIIPTGIRYWVQLVEKALARPE